MDKNTLSKLSKTPAGRKYALAIMIFIAATLLCAITPALSVFVFKTATPLVILTGSEWVTVMGMIGAFYFSANVAQKHIEKPVSVRDELKKEIERKKELEQKKEDAVPADVSSEEQK